MQDRYNAAPVDDLTHCCQSVAADLVLICTRRNRLSLLASLKIRYLKPGCLCSRTQSAACFRVKNTSNPQSPPTPGRVVCNRSCECAQLCRPDGNPACGRARDQWRGISASSNAGYKDALRFFYTTTCGAQTAEREMPT